MKNSPISDFNLIFSHFSNSNFYDFLIVQFPEKFLFLKNANNFVHSIELFRRSTWYLKNENGGHFHVTIVP